MKKSIFFSAIIFSIILLASLIPLRNEANTFHTEEERKQLMELMTMDLTVDSNLMFPKSAVCEGCHGYDENEFAYVTSDGDEVNVFDDWQSSMMANSAKDPFWRAKVSHEVLLHPNEKEEIETKCTSCHAPMGHYTAILRGAEHYTLDSLVLDSIGLDGVGCAACHKIANGQIGDLFSGEINYDTSRVIFGPFPGPFDGPMNDFVGFDPLYAPHMNDAGLCASCHTLITETHDLEGNPTGDSFIEQATYHEWENSLYEDEQSCQHCHIPQLDEEIVISSNYAFLEGRTPFGRHDLVGANTMMLQLMAENREALDIEASLSDYFQTIDKTLDMLQQQSVDMVLTMENEISDTAYFALELKNKAGHKFPSGYPSRRATVEFLLTSDAGDTLFHSGGHLANFEVNGHNETYEPHYDIISKEDEVQIYEMVFGDVNGDVSTVLLRGASMLKDNRLVPQGFTTSHVVYDTTRIEGNAVSDANFNYENGVEGSGKDLINYHIPLEGYYGAVNVSARVWYQSLPPKWMEEMFGETTPEIEVFREMFDNADQSPVLIGTQILQDQFVGVSAIEDFVFGGKVKIFPNPSSGFFSLDYSDDLKIGKMVIRDLQGREIQYSKMNNKTFSIDRTGVYFVTVFVDGKEWTEKVVVK